MEKTYIRINWENYPSEATPLNESNLNRIDYATNEIDNRVISLDTTKLSLTDANNLITGISLDNETGVITVTKRDGSTSTISTNLAKITLGWSYNAQTQQIVLTQSDGTLAYIDLSTLIQQNEFVDSATIAFAITNGVVTATIKNHSITADQLQEDYLADIQTAEANASASESAADADATRSESWAIGGTNTRAGEDTNNSMYYSQLADSSRQAAEVAKDDAEALVAEATARLTNLTIMVNLQDGNLYYDNTSGIMLQIDQTTGNLMYGVNI